MKDRGWFKQLRSILGVEEGVGSVLLGGYFEVDRDGNIEGLVPV